MLADDILALLRRKPMTSGELARELKKPESIVLTVLMKELQPELVEMKDGLWKRKPPQE